MSAYPDCLEKLIVEFSKLPGIGKKTAERLSIYVLNSNKNEIIDFSEALTILKNSIETCSVCNCLIENNFCHLCNDSYRNNKLLCIVKEPTDIFIIEKSSFKGKYHVLGGLISPLDGITPEKLNFDSLLNRLNGVDEVILGIDPSQEGDMTSLYIMDLLKSYDIKVTRLARGIPVGSSLEFVDDITLSHSLNDRVEVK
tara:strand:+ start:1833 stop:2426 length:594 start_codon:yes stop_codon:yes gene_type:complete